MKNLLLLPVLGLGLGLGGCAHNDPGVRKDVISKMESVQGTLSTCYADAMTRTRRLRGKMVVGITAEPLTGKFTNVQVKQNELAEEGLVACVTQAIANLKLDKVTATPYTFEYPIHFQRQR